MVQVDQRVLWAAVAAGCNVLGALVVAAPSRRGVRWLDGMLALAAGFMLGVTLIDVLPEALERGGHEAALIAAGAYVAVHFTQHTLVRHFHFGEETHAVSADVGMAALLGLIVHTLVDGVAIASGFAAGTRFGVVLFLAILLHKLPEGLAIASLFLAAGATRVRALAASGVLGVATVVGALLTGLVPWLAEHGLALSAGVTLYVAASNLVPHVQKRHDWRLEATLYAGFVMAALSRYLLPH